MPSDVQTVKNIDPTVDALLVPGTTLSTVLDTLYTAQRNTVITWYEFFNTDSSTRTVTVHAVPSGGSPGVASHVMDVPLTAGQHLSVASGEVILSGYTLRLSASAANVVRASVSGRIQSL